MSYLTKLCHSMRFLLRIMTSIGPSVVLICLLTAFLCFMFIKNDARRRRSIANRLNINGRLSSAISDETEFLRYSLEQNNQRYAQNSNADRVEMLYFSYLPQVSCGTQVRIGGFHDGGKWVCNPWRLRENCTVYSVGLGRNVQFDLEMLNKFQCNVYAFDPHQKYGVSLIMQVNNSSKLSYQPWFIGGFNQGNHRMTLTKAVQYYGHEIIDLLKIDAEGSEFDMLEEFFAVERNVQICQLLVEVHGKAVNRWQSLFKLFQNAGFLLFSREPNVYSISPSIDAFCVEYSYIHNSCLKNFGLFNVPVIMNFDDDE